MFCVNYNWLNFSGNVTQKDIEDWWDSAYYEPQEFLLKISLELERGSVLYKKPFVTPEGGDDKGLVSQSYTVKALIRAY